MREWIEKDMVALRIFDEYRMVTVASPAYLSANPAITAPEDLCAHNCIQRRWTKDGAIHPWEYESNGRRSQVVVGGSLVVNDPHLILQAAQSRMLSSCNSNNRSVAGTHG